MLIRLGYDIQFDLPFGVSFVNLLNVHPSVSKNLCEPDELIVEPALPVSLYTDSFGNLCTRFLAQQGALRLYNSTAIQVSDDPDPVEPSASEIPVEALP